MKRASHLTQSFTQGFTFVELMVALSMTSVVVAMAFAALQYTLNRDQAAAQREARQTELNRALDFIADDVREAIKVSPLTTNGESVMRLDRADGSWINYSLVNRGKTSWRGPTFIYRQECAPTRQPNICSPRIALVDAIAIESMDEVKPIEIDHCPGNGTVFERKAARSGGFRVILIDPSRLRICLAGHLPDTHEHIVVSTQVFTRGVMEP